MRVAFTGTEAGLSPLQFKRLHERLKELMPSVLVHGACVGADSEADWMAVELGIPREVFPAHPASESSVARHLAERGGTLKSHPPLRPSQSPLVRNHDIIRGADVLLACPRESYEIMRSGTWATVRYARKAGLKVEILPPV